MVCTSLLSCALLSSSRPNSRTPLLRFAETRIHRRTSINVVVHEDPGAIVVLNRIKPLSLIWAPPPSAT